MTEAVVLQPSEMRIELIKARKNYTDSLGRTWAWNGTKYVYQRKGQTERKAKAAHRKHFKGSRTDRKSGMFVGTPTPAGKRKSTKTHPAVGRFLDIMENDLNYNPDRKSSTRDTAKGSRARGTSKHFMDSEVGKKKREQRLDKIADRLLPKYIALRKELGWTEAGDASADLIIAATHGMDDEATERVDELLMKKYRRHKRGKD